MSDNTPNLTLDYVLEGQANSEKTHNEFLNVVDTIVQLTIADRDLTSPPESPATGSAWIVGSSSTGAWLNHDGDVAWYYDDEWYFRTPKQGWRAWIIDEDVFLIYDNANWQHIKTLYRFDAAPECAIAAVGGEDYNDISTWRDLNDWDAIQGVSGWTIPAGDGHITVIAAAVIQVDTANDDAALAIAYDDDGNGSCAHGEMKGERRKVSLKLDGDADCTRVVIAAATFELNAAARTLWVKLWPGNGNLTLLSYTLTVIRASSGALLAEV